jgi:hypothetical protein
MINHYVTCVIIIKKQYDIIEAYVQIIVVYTFDRPFMHFLFNNVHIKQD